MNQVFNENYHGILTHDGWIKVAKFNLTAKIVNIQGNKTIQVKGRKNKNSYHCNIHKNLKNDIKFMDVGDTVGIKWNCGRPYVVGYRKQGYDTFAGKKTGDFQVSENTNWMEFFKRIDAE